MVNDLLLERFTYLMQDDKERRTRELQEFVKDLMTELLKLDARVAIIEGIMGL